MQCFSKRCLLAFTENQALERNFSFEVATWQSQTHKNSVTSMQHLSHVFPHLLFLRFTAKDSQNLPSIEDGNTFVVTCQMSFNFYLIWLNWINTSHQLGPTNYFTSLNILIDVSWVFSSRSLSLLIGPNTLIKEIFQNHLVYIYRKFMALNDIGTKRWIPVYVSRRRIITHFT